MDGWVILDLTHVAAILIFSHSNQCNQTEAGMKNSLVLFSLQLILLLIAFVGYQEHDRDGCSRMMYIAAGTHLCSCG